MERERFSRTGFLLGRDKIEQLADVKIAVFGLGGVGTCVTEFLARSGAACFYLYDFDSISLSNCNRLLTAGTATLGKKKAEVMRDRVMDINPDASVVAEPLFVNGENVVEILEKGKFDLIIDAIDSLNPKVTLLQEAVLREEKIISSMGAAARLDPSQVYSTHIWKTINCPLAAKVRQGLRRRGIKARIPVVYSKEFPAPPKPPEEDNSMDVAFLYPKGRLRNIQPSISFLPAVFGAHLARLALMELKII